MSASQLFSKVIHLGLSLKGCLNLGINKFLDIRPAYKVSSAILVCAFSIASVNLLVSEKYSKRSNEEKTTYNLQNAEIKIHTNSAHHPSIIPNESVNKTSNEKIPLDSEKPNNVFSNIFDFIDYIDNVNSSDMDIRKVVTYIESSTEAFNHIKNAFWITEDPDLRQTYLFILDSSEIEDKYDIAMELADSSSVSERKMAYEWLSYSTSSKPSQIQDKLINAFETETDTDLLVDLITIVKTSEQDDVVNDRLVSRIKDLSYHHNERVSANAIVTLGQVAQNESTLDFLISSIENMSPTLQLATIKSLKFFDYPGADVIDNLHALSNNPSIPQHVRSAAVGAIVTFENYVSANKEQTGPL